MKRLLIFLFVMVSMVNAGALTDQELFVQANEFYKAGKCKEAQELYEKISDKSSRVYYNLGNCAYKQGKYGYALLNWRRAEADWGLFNRAELVRNIALVKKMVGGIESNAQQPEQQNPVQRLMLGLHGLKNATVSFIRSTPLLFLQILFLIVWFIIFAVSRFLYRKKQGMVILGLFFLLVSIGSALAVKYGLSMRQYGVILHKSSLMSGPGEGYHALGEIAEAQEVVIQKQSADYCKVKVHGQIGWLKCKNVGTV